LYLNERMARVVFRISKVVWKFILNLVIKFILYIVAMQKSVFESFSNFVATHGMIHQSLFSSLSMTSNLPIITSAANGSQIQSQGIDTTHPLLSLTAESVLLVPNCPFNLLLVHCLTTKDCPFNPMIV